MYFVGHSRNQEAATVLKDKGEVVLKKAESQSRTQVNPAMSIESYSKKEKAAKSPTKEPLDVKDDAV